MRIQPIHELIIGIKGAGEIATAVAWHLYMARIRKIFMMETAQPMAVRRRVSFCEAIYTGSQMVENVTAVRGDDPSAISSAWKNKFMKTQYSFPENHLNQLKLPFAFYT